MNLSTHSDALSEADQCMEPRSKPRGDAAPQEHSPDEQSPPRNPAGPFVPDEGAVDTFVGGAGI
jgi:hypothetical protein